MALDFNIVQKFTPNGANDAVFGIVDITLDAAYPDGGWAVAGSDLGMQSVLYLAPQATSAGGTVLFYDAATKKILAYEQDGAQGALIACTSADNLNDGDIVRCFFIAT